MSEMSWEDLCGDLPDHPAAMAARDLGRPTVAEQDRTHGAGLPAADDGPDPESVTG
jgi:hypothetical protein